LAKSLEKNLRNEKIKFSSGVKALNQWELKKEKIKKKFS
jgi:hypothetical protein